MSNVLRDLDKRDTAILKGLAISAIVFHNFFHILSPVEQNEFAFYPYGFSAFLQNVAHPATAIQALFSFFGHYGVQVFIFLSAYGLAKTHWDDTSSWTSFMWSRIKKFYPMFCLVILFWAVLASFQMGPLWVIREAGPGLLFMLAGVSNLMPGVGFPVIGPWWFIPFIMQFYAIWLLLRWVGKKFGWQGLLVLSVVCLLITLAINPTLMRWDINLNETPFGRLRVFCLGIIAARYPIRINAPLAIGSLAVLILGSAYETFWPLASLASVILSLWLYVGTRKVLRQIPLLEQIGDYSLPIFLLNGIVRVPFIAVARTLDSQLPLGLASAVVTVALSVFFHHLVESALKAKQVPAEKELAAPIIPQPAES